MVWDLRGALLKKQEVESARLDDFDFRLRARTMRLLASLLGPGCDANALIRKIVLDSDEAMVADLQQAHPDLTDMHARYLQCRAEARRQLLEEYGDPSPHRLA